MNLLESPQRQTVAPSPEIQQYSLGPSWQERPICKSRPGGSGGQHVEHELTKLLAVRRAPPRLGCMNQSMASISRKQLYPTAINPHLPCEVMSIDQFWAS